MLGAGAGAGVPLSPWTDSTIISKSLSWVAGSLRMATKDLRSTFDWDDRDAEAELEGVEPSAVAVPDAARATPVATREVEVVVPSRAPSGGVDVEVEVAREESVGEDAVVVSRVRSFGDVMAKVRAAELGGGTLRLDEVAVELEAVVEFVIGVVGTADPLGVSAAGRLESRLGAEGDLERLERCAVMIDLQKARASGSLS